jgi:two-component system, LytTR family, sensor kinase
MKKFVVALLHSAYWLTYLLLHLILFVLIANEFRTNDPAITVPDALLRWIRFIAGFTLVPGIIGFYTYHSVLFERYLKTKKIRRFFGGVFITGFVGIAAGLTVFRFIGIPEAEWNIQSPALISISIFIFFITTVNGVLGLVMNGFVNWYADIRFKEELQQKNYETELALLKARLNPHFLFNTINNIDVLIRKDADKASLYLNRLSDILRFLLYEGQKEEVLLEKELEYISKYIELQRIRSNNPDFVKFTIEGNPAARTIASMLFIPFIENAFKYAENKKAGDAIQVAFTITADRIVFSCRNNIQAMQQSAPEAGGLGNALISKRLALLYPGKHTLHAGKNGNTYLVELELNV